MIPASFRFHIFADPVGDASFNPSIDRHFRGLVVVVAIRQVLSDRVDCHIGTHRELIRSPHRCAGMIRSDDVSLYDHA